MFFRFTKKYYRIKINIQRDTSEKLCTYSVFFVAFCLCMTIEIADIFSVLKEKVLLCMMPSGTFGFRTPHISYIVGQS
jgi:hypothetical protein